MIIGVRRINYPLRTDANGAFSIDSIDTGGYYIEINDGKSHAVLLTCDIMERDTLVRIPDDTLYPRILQKVCAPAILRKQPDIFCLTLFLLKSLSAGLFDVILVDEAHHSPAKTESHHG